MDFWYGALTGTAVLAAIALAAYRIEGWLKVRERIRDRLAGRLGAR